MVQININGEARTVAPDTHVSALVADMQLTGKRYAIERNGEIIPKSKHAETRVESGDSYEIVVAVGGG